MAPKTLGPSAAADENNSAWQFPGLWCGHLACTSAMQKVQAGSPHHNAPFYRHFRPPRRRNPVSFESRENEEMRSAYGNTPLQIKSQ